MTRALAVMALALRLLSQELQASSSPALWRNEVARDPLGSFDLSPCLMSTRCLKFAEKWQQEGSWRGQLLVPRPGPQASWEPCAWASSLT